LGVSFLYLQKKSLNKDAKHYFTFALSIDCVVFGFDGKDLKILLIERNEIPYANHWALPGDLLDPKDDLNNSVNIILKNLTGLSNLFFEQVETFGEINRHPQGRVITTSYFTVVNQNKYKVNPASFAAKAKWWKIEKANELKLAFDHNIILNKCFKRLQDSIRTKPIGFELLNQTFSLTEIQTLYEAILKMKLDTRNFRKKILQMNFLKETDKFQSNVSHRPAKLYRFELEKYELLKKEGFSFEI